MPETFAVSIALIALLGILFAITAARAGRELPPRREESEDFNWPRRVD